MYIRDAVEEILALGGGELVPKDSFPSRTPCILWEICHCHHDSLLVLSGRFLTFSSSLARIIVLDINKCKIHRSGY